MSIRLNKALRELNIGLQTAVEFLEKRKDLGDVKAEPSFKLTDQQYKALNDAFSQDREVRDQAEKLFTKKAKDKKRAPEQKDNRAESLLESNGQQQYKPLGKIDLDNIGKKPAAESVAEKPETAAICDREKCGHINHNDNNGSLLRPDVTYIHDIPHICKPARANCVQLGYPAQPDHQ